ncbi:MAG: 6-bladed beta-propeller [bacterium]|nr:6-bladed beta-propeller [bacterium]
MPLQATMRHIIAILLVLVLHGTLLHAKKLTQLEDVFRFPFLLIDNKQLYVYDKFQKRVFIYSRKNFKKITEFGRKGQGPGEFQAMSSVSLRENTIIINSFPKLCVYSKKGIFKNEIKCNSNSGSFIPLGSNYIGIREPRSRNQEKSKLVFCLFDANLDKIRDVCTMEFKKFVTFTRPKMTAFYIRDCTRAQVYRNRLYVGSTDKGFFFSVFNHDGDKCYEIKREYEKRTVSREDKERIIELAKSGFKKGAWQNYISRVKIDFPEYYPAYENFYVDNEGIYVFGFPDKNHRKVYLLDLKGNLLKTKTIPADTAKGVFEQGHFVMRAGKFYYLRDNPTEEAWELHVLDLGK